MSAIIKELKAAGYERVGPSSVVEAFEVMMNLPKDEIKRVSEDPRAPMSARIVSQALLSRKGWDVLQAMMDRAHGKAKQQVDMAASVTGNAPSIMVQVLPPSPNVGG